MFPVLFSIGTISFYTETLSLLLCWALFSFVFWRYLKDQGIEETPIYDMMFYGTFAAGIGGRLGFIIEHPELFTNWKWIRVFTPWIQPGLTVYPALFGILIVSFIIGFRNHIKAAHILDAFAHACGAAFFVGAIGALFSGSVIGTASNTPLAVVYRNLPGTRHPVGLYEAVLVAGICIILEVIFSFKRIQDRKPGLYAMWFFLLFSIGAFCLEFFKESRVYWGGLHLNQWILVMIFAECVGALLVWGGGKEALIKTSHWIVRSIKKIGGGLYAKFSKRTA